MRVAVLHASGYRYEQEEGTLARVIQKWLDSHPDARIEHVAQSQEGPSGVMTFTILYR